MWRLLVKSFTVIFIHRYIDPYGAVDEWFSYFGKSNGADNLIQNKV
jgi:hypothetical protein